MEYLQFIFALIFVITLMLGLAWLVKKSGLNNVGSLSKNNSKRLSIVEVLPIDTRRRLMLIRRDDKEHLIILSPTREIVIETGISNPSTISQDGV